MIVAFTTPAMGHVKPMLPLLRGLVEDGQEVVCFGHTKFETIVRATGARFEAYPEIQYDIDAPDFNLIKMAADLIDASETIYPALLGKVEALAPRLIVQDFMALWGSRIGTELSIPRVHTIPTLVFNRETQRQMRREDGLLKLARDVSKGMPALIRSKFRSKFAVSVQEAFGLERSWRKLAPPVCELVFCIEALQVGNPRGDVPRHYIGPSYSQSEAPVSPVERKHALITFGTLSNNETERFRAAIEGAFLAGYSVIAQCGGKVDIQHLERVGQSLENQYVGQTATIVESVPDLEVLIAEAAVVIHHAGMATTWETVRHSKPALFIPTIADQKVLASQLEAKGFGVRLAAGNECNAQVIAKALKSVETRSYSWGQIQQWLLQAGGEAAGVKIINDVLEQRP
ncbi:glycosyltransferase [Pseudahrensia aquimaris]|uniref:Glycosyltransferase n=1 Tax=Pseudahrensia aquimaris TaxID=744461 RepID=A0ABW3FE11_9HYPH